MDNGSPKPIAKLSRMERYQTQVVGLMSIIVALAAWQIATMIFDIPSYVLPAPEAVWNALVAGLGVDPRSHGSFLYQLSDTLQATFFGFLIGSFIGISLAAAMVEVPLLEKVLFPYIVGFQCIPKVAIAPLYVIWFGYKSESKIAMAATLTLFPVLLNAMEGFATVERERLQLMASLGAKRWQTFVLIKLPGALPFVFAGLNLGIVYAYLGAIVSEFIGAQRGVGVVITQLQAVSDTAGVFAILALLAASGFLMIAIIRECQRRVVFWGSTKADIVV